MAEGRTSIVITVFSTASGVGKTSLATNLAAGVAQEGYSVCLIDLDLQYGDVCNYLQLPHEKIPTILDAQNALKKNPDKFDIRDFLSEYEENGVSFSVLPPPRKIEESYRIDDQSVISMINDMEYFKFIIVDTKADFSELNMLVMDVSTIINFLCVSDFVPAIKNLKSGYDAILRFGYDVNKVRLILNRSDSQTLIDPDDVEKVLEKPFYHRLCNDFRSMNESIQSGCPLILSDSDSRLKDDLWNLVGLYTNRPSEKLNSSSKGGFKNWMKNLFKS